MSEDVKICRQCGTSFARPADTRPSLWQRRRYCSRACAALARTKPLPERQCRHCGLTLHRQNAEGAKQFSRRHYCSSSCAEAASRAADPTYVGDRALICRTCTECGCLLLGEKFRRRSNGVRERTCIACTQRRDRARMSDERRARIAEYMRRSKTARHVATAAAAKRGGLQWTGAEMEILAQHPEAPLMELARLLGRTYIATAHKRSAINRGEIPSWIVGGASDN